MIFQYTYPWVIGASPWTGERKTMTSRLAGLNGDYVVIQGEPHQMNVRALPGSDQHVRELLNPAAVLAPTDVILEVNRCYRVKWRVGVTYSVQPARARRGLGRILLSAITFAERAEFITEDEARAEGFGSPAQFCDEYAKINGKSALALPCYRLSWSNNHASN
jgi:hypothetical protein